MSLSSRKAEENPPHPRARNIVFVLAKHPEAGKVKTRLGDSIGTAEAAALYRAFLADLVTHLIPRDAIDDFDVCWTYLPDHAPFPHVLSELAGMPLPRAFFFRGFQRPDLLGHQQLLIQYARREGYERIVIVVSDSPQLTRQHVRAAFQALADTDVVLGPAQDGGYYLLGVGTKEDVLRDTPMSTKTVAENILQNAQSANLSVHVLRPLMDVDTRADLDALTAILADGMVDTCPATSTFVGSLAQQGILGPPSLRRHAKVKESNAIGADAVTRWIRSACPGAVQRGGPQAVCIALPNIPERAGALKLCKLIDAEALVVAPYEMTEDALSGILRRVEAALIIVADWWEHGGVMMPAKTIADRASVCAPTLEAIVVVRVIGRSISWLDGRDSWFNTLPPQVQPTGRRLH
jgi:rSAM/selenodomain-associated transferase 1